jgi:hypothetical protein
MATLPAQGGASILDVAALLADLVCFGEPDRNFVIDLVNALEPKRVEMISRRESFDAPETGMFETTRQDDMAVYPISANDKRRETHPHMKCDPRLFGQNGDRPILSRDLKQLVEDGAHGGRFAFKMSSKRVTAARMRLIAIRKCPATVRTSPKPS